MKVGPRIPAATVRRVLPGAVSALVLALFLPSAFQARAEADDPCTECSRRQRKVFEALQAWRRAHGGEYPRYLRELEEGGFITAESLVCPAMVRELEGGSSRHDLITARGPDGDPVRGYEYELAPEGHSTDKRLHPEGRPPTRRDIKFSVLRKPFWEQVPILRCAGHRTEAPPELKGGEPFRNLTAEGRVYWSGEYWERLWYDQVPAPARGALTLNAECGPPFHSGKPAPEGFLDLRPWVNANPRLPWTWGASPYPGRMIPDLKVFFPNPGGASLPCGTRSFWVDGIVQTQGMPETREGAPGFSHASGEAYPYERRNLRVERKIHRAVWLQGSAWSALKDERKAADLVWRYADGSSMEVPVVYGKNVWRYAATEPHFQGTKSNLPEPALSALVQVDPAKPDPKNDLRYTLWSQEWENPRPEVPIATLDLIGNRNCAAGIFLLSVSVE